MIISKYRFIIFCPKGVRTGGPEALHQLVATLVKLNREAYIVYYGDHSAEDVLEEYFQHP